MNIGKLKGNKITYLIIALAAGVFLVMISGMFDKPKEAPKKEISEAVLPDTDKMEKRLEEIIATIDGVSDVSVFVTYENSGVKNVAFATEKNDTADGEKKSSSVKSQVITSKDSSGESPFVDEEILPQIRGVIICAKGVDSENLRLTISDAVSASLGVPLHRVKVLCKN